MDHPSEASESKDSMMPGYLSPLYAESLSEFGEPLELPGCGGHLLRRSIGAGPYFDAMGCYPLFCCQDWTKLKGDLDAIAPDLVNVSIVTDPFGNWDEALLRSCFPDKAISFKEHYVTDLAQPRESYVSQHNRRYARKALREVEVEICGGPMDYLEDWSRLYANLVQRHDITGIPAFSAQSFEAQFRVPGLVLLRASIANETVGLMLWYEQGDAAYYHLGAYDDRGYQHRASYALVSHAIDLFSERGLKWLTFGGPAGLKAHDDDGLARFKSGWSTERRMTWFCGRVFNAKLYAELSDAAAQNDSNYFPKYRTGEFG